MDHETLRSLLTQLQQELTANPPTDEPGRQLLQELRQEIERAVAPVVPGGHGTTAPTEPHNLRERLQQAVAGFEGSHPQSAAALERVLVLLSNFGL